MKAEEVEQLVSVPYIEMIVSRIHAQGFLLCGRTCVMNDR